MNAIEAIRREMPITEQCLYFDAAYDNGGSLLARRAMEQYFEDWAHAARNMERGGPGRRPFFAAADEARAEIAALLGGVEAKNVCFTRNTNEGLNHIMQGFRFAPGDNIVLCDIEHPSVLLPCLNAQRLRGVECRVAHSPDGVRVTPELLEAQCDGHTRIIAVSHIQSSSGWRIDLAALGRFCAEHGIYLVTDAIQSLGIVPMHAAEWNVAAVTAAGYKGLLAVESTAFLYVRTDLLRELEPLYVGMSRTLSVDRTNWTLSVSEPENARKLENSSLDSPGIYSLRAGVRRLNEVGAEQIWAHVCRLYDRLHDGLTALGYTPVSSRRADEHGGTLTLRMRDQDAAAAYFTSRGVAFGDSTFFRLSIGSYTSEEDIDRLLEIAADCPQQAR